MKEFDGYKIIECNTFKNRLFGLMFKKNFDYGLLFNHCRSIHTFFMRKDIDIIFLDNNNCVIKRYNNVKRNKVLICFKARKVIEIPSKY